MRAIGIILLVVVAVVVVAALVGPVREWVAVRAHAARERRVTRRAHREAAAARWAHYCSPTVTAGWVFGAERVTASGTRLGHITWPDLDLPSDASEAERLVNVAAAQQRTSSYNSALEGQ